RARAACNADSSLHAEGSKPRGKRAGTEKGGVVASVSGGSASSFALPDEQAAEYDQARVREGRLMTVEREALRDWHRLFGLLLTDYFSGSPFVVEVER